MQPVTVIMNKMIFHRIKCAVPTKINKNRNIASSSFLKRDPSQQNLNKASKSNSLCTEIQYIPSFTQKTGPPQGISKYGSLFHVEIISTFK